MSIHTIMHPEFSARLLDWDKWRVTYEGGEAFIDKYLKTLSSRESSEDFIVRKAITYCPSFAKMGINEIRDSIYQRMSDIVRLDGTKSYQDAILGLNGGVDLEGASMNYFMGCKVLPELLTMGKIGIYVDMPPKQGPSIADNATVRPYIYLYPCESIRSWCDDSADSNEHLAVLLEDNVYEIDPKTGFPKGTMTRLRHVWKEPDGGIYACFYNEKGDMIDQNGQPLLEPIKLGINRVPFVLAEISESLLTDVADYQIALLNLASTDMAYQMNLNFPLYTEQFDPKSDAPHLRKRGLDGPGTAADAEKGKVEEIKIGVRRGRRYPVGMERPDFISPSAEPMRVSMEKQEQLKAEIRHLLKLSVSNLRGPKMASAESKREDDRSLETGLSYIGLALENAERKIGAYWSMYEGEKDKTPTINYPENYSLRSEEDRRNEAKELNDLMIRVPSKTYQKAIAKRMAKIMLGPKVTRQDSITIDSEIDAAVTMDIDAKTIQIDVETGLVSTELASQIRGYPKGEAEKSKQDHAERLARIAEAQSENQSDVSGIKDGQDKPRLNAQNQKKQSRDTTQDDTVSDKTRGDGD